MGQAQGAGALLSAHDGSEPRSGARLTAESPPPQLEVLLLRIADGEQDSFADLYDRVAARVHGLAVRILRNRSLAEEVTQEVLLQVWREAARFDPARGSALAWLLSLTHRRAVDRVRSEQAQSERLRRYESPENQTPYDSTAEEALARWDASRVRRVLDEVGEPHRSTLGLVYFGGLTHREAAQQLGVPLGTAKTRIRDGLRKVRDRMTGGEQE